VHDCLNIRRLFESVVHWRPGVYYYNSGLEPEDYHRYYSFFVNVKLLISFYSMRWHQDSCTKQNNLQMYSSNRCPAECSVFGETATHVVLKTQLATAFYRTLRKCKNYVCLVRLLQICTKQNHHDLLLQVFRMARLVRATGI